MSASMKKQGGFTIVETLLVLAVAGLILLLIFGAIPALQRNSRNSARKQDVQTILGAVSQWQLNHSGTLPTTPTPANNFLQYGKLRSYDAIGGVTVTALTVGASAPAQTSLDRVSVYNRQKCVSGGTTSPQGAGYYDVVALYRLETASGTAPHCQQL